MHGHDALATALAIARALHFGACMVLLGEALFGVLVLDGASTSAAAAVQHESRIRRTMVWAALGVAIASALAWLAVVALVVTGDPPRETFRAPVLLLVVQATTFGRLWLVRLALLLAAALAMLLSATSSSSRRREPVALGLVTLFTAALLASLAWTGHAGAATGVSRPLQLASDAAHVVTGAVWLGMLPALVRALRAGSMEDRLRITRRFSRVALAAVLVVLVSGSANTLYRVVPLSALAASSYGLVLVGKVMIVAAMLSLAAINRWRETPALAASADAARRLARNARAEIVGAIAVVALAATLGVLAPPMAMPQMPPRAVSAIATPASAHTAPASARAPVPGAAAQMQWMHHAPLKNKTAAGIPAAASPAGVRLVRLGKESSPPVDQPTRTGT